MRSWFALLCRGLLFPCHSFFSFVDVSCLVFFLRVRSCTRVTCPRGVKSVVERKIRETLQTTTAKSPIENGAAYNKCRASTIGTTRVTRPKSSSSESILIAGS